MKHCDTCDFWKDVNDNGYGTCTCKDSTIYMCRTLGFHECSMNAKSAFGKLGYVQEKTDDHIIYTKEIDAASDMKKIVDFNCGLKSFSVEFTACPGTRLNILPSIDMDLFGAITKQLNEFHWVTPE